MCNKWISFKTEHPPLYKVVWLYIKDSGEIFLTASAGCYCQCSDSDILFWRYPDKPKDRPIDN